MNKRRDIRNFYVDEEFVDTWKTFGKIVKREGSNNSEKIRELITQYVTEHSPGNPQPPITNWTDETKPADPFGCGETISIGKVNVRCKIAGKVGIAYCRHACNKNVRRDINCE